MTILFRSVLAAAAVMLAANAGPNGFYARNASLIWDRLAGSPTSLKLTSPDGTSHVDARYSENADGDGLVSLTVSGHIGAGKVQLGAGVGSELIWAPGSRAFAVTSSDGGGNGPYHVIIVAKGPHGLQSRT